MEIAAGKFKAQCLKLMDLVRENREKITITKRGKPVAQLVPVKDEKPRKIFGFLQGLITEENDIISPVDEEWDADGGGS